MFKQVYALVGAGLTLGSFAHADGSSVSTWLAAVSANQAQQPHWVTPLVTVTPRLEQEYRFDYVNQAMPNDLRSENFGNTKGLELIIPGANVEIALNAPGYLYRPGDHRKSGYTDSSVLLKYRVAAANEEDGNYIISAFLAQSFPTGSAGVGYDSRIYTPTLAVGKGFGDVDVQSTLSYSMPDHDEKKLGHQTSWNTAFQYHLARHYWPEIEYNQIHFADGPHDGQTQGVVTTGIVTKWPLQNRLAAVVGVGYQQPVTSFHTYTHAVTATARLAF